MGKEWVLKRLNNLILNDGTTKINANYFAFKYEKAKDFGKLYRKGSYGARYERFIFKLCKQSEKLFHH